MSLQLPGSSLSITQNYTQINHAERKEGRSKRIGIPKAGSVEHISHKSQIGHESSKP